MQLKQSQLQSEEKAFFRTVYHAAFANPFGELRERLDRKIAGLFPEVPRRESSDLCIEEVDKRIKRLENEGRGSIQGFTGKDKEIIQVVFLFDIFHKFRDRFDQLIIDQMKAGETPVHVSFAEEAMKMLHKRGIPEKKFLHYFAFSFQLRRAFFFISNFLVGTSPCMKELKRNLWNNVFTNNIQLYDNILWNRMEDFSTLILGETGTGKGTAAMAIGRSGFIPFDEKKGCFKESFTSAFIPINLSQFPEALLESELFGHKKGAFTGAVEDHKGVFQHCSSHGSIFLDEIGEVPGHIQIKLLHVLQERVFTPVGSHHASRFRGRVIAATNRPMSAITDGSIFRDDFYYRLCSDMFEVPPLRLRIRQQPGELQELLSFTVERILGKKSEELVQKVSRIIDRQLGKDYHWPGNVREVEQCVKRIILRRNYEGHPHFKKGKIENSGESKTDCLKQNSLNQKSQETDILRQKLRETDASPQKLETRKLLLQSVENGEMDVTTLVSTYCRLLYHEHGTYEAVARTTGLDRRTVKKYIKDR
ncbi:Sigma-54 dependent transcriptional regulator [Desulfamplus magnetovallimortis]|uniref:Sigma-54 dependent transcriptional regulator n=1 Tax=Desulfamplus magnetovallimortis TaxID=1246637 RepID=A0A1W1H7I2_9BACT|nr:sigma 54-interacting transcriptional regulator [Desulfamplus magnetovallimortis]SLM28413.1 Sigma-54 dependent transcriptional regulator [Desulfamplus magnetovallimortis]